MFKKNQTKNLIRGVGSIMEIAPPKRKIATLKRIYYKPAPTSYDALKEDWKKVGNSIQAVINRYTLESRE